MDSQRSGSARGARRQFCERPRAGVPLTTALRWIATLETEGLIDRQNDRFDRRRTFLELSEKGRTGMSAYFEELHPDTKIL